MNYNNSNVLSELEQWKEAILKSIDPLDIVSAWVKNAKYDNKGIRGECPFPHDGTFGSDKKRRFYMLTDQTYYPWLCYRCDTRGDIIKLVMKAAGLDYMEALEYLGDKCGIPRPDAKNTDGVSEHDIQKVLYDATLTFHYSLVGSKSKGKEPNKEALDYLINKRGLSLDIINRFKIGYCDKIPYSPPDTKRDVMIAAGFYRKKDDGSTYPSVDDSISIPIFRGTRVLNITFRRLHEATYINKNTKEEVQKRKHNHLRLHKMFFNQSALRSNEVYVNEGPLDAISYEQHGFNSIATLGATAFKDSYVTRFSKDSTIYLSFDDDEAGQIATNKISKSLMSSGIWNIRVVTFLAPPDGSKMDANRYFCTHTQKDFISCIDVMKEDIITWMLRINKSSDLVSSLDVHMFDKIKRIQPIVKCVAPVVPLAREVFLQQIAKATGVPIEGLRSEVLYYEDVSCLNEMIDSIKDEND